MVENQMGPSCNVIRIQLMASCKWKCDMGAEQGSPRIMWTLPLSVTVTQSSLFESNI
ncbi:hypothetical protein KIN20_019654 [Parelaphostrongylus tenuis]|uniref:Uncharacterized protein n=1 Tax=Parelaphostrongylus tenuis TaxID=148309 RepID=A0AAD5N8Y5_PARTN|nr:hypothetical protein KIN20_019654 [Parelaphostrongylus tenuis]